MQLALRTRALLACFMSLASATSSIRGPPVASQRNLFVVGKLGEEVKLACPIEGNPSPMIEWRKSASAADGQESSSSDEKIDEFTHAPRFKPNRRSLKIRDVTQSDSGRFVCRGVNGFGSEEVSVRLLVIDPADWPAGDVRPADIRPPSLAPETVVAREEFEKTYGDVWSVTCLVVGQPPPVITWLKDGQVVVQQSHHHNQQQQQIAGSTIGNGESSTLRIANLRDADSGTYTCRAANLAGNVSKHYRLNVRRTLAYEAPVFVGRTPANQTVGAGETAALDCHVTSKLPITIKWLKKVEPRPRDDLSGRYHADNSKDDLKVITVGKDSYRIIDQRPSNSVSGVSTTRHTSSASVRRSNPPPVSSLSGGSNIGMARSLKEYVSKLELVESTPEDSGLYICFATNTRGGYNYRQAHLTVINAVGAIGGAGGDGGESPLVLTISISLAGVTLAVLVGLMVCLVRSRHSAAGGNNKQLTSAADVGGAEVRSTLIAPTTHQQPTLIKGVGRVSAINGPPPPVPPPSVQDTVYSNTGHHHHPLPPPPPGTPVQWSMVYGGNSGSGLGNNGVPSHHTSYTDSSQYGGLAGNTYEVPRYVTTTERSPALLAGPYGGVGGQQRAPPEGQLPGPVDYMYGHGYLR